MVSARVLLVVLLIPPITSSGTAITSVWYVDGTVQASGDGLSWATAFKTIQGGIDSAADDDTVVVAEGIYFENIRFESKNITLTSIDPFDPAVVAQTIIDGGQVGSAVTFEGREDETCVLCGFTIQNGLVRSPGGAGIRGSGTQASIRNNLIVGNHTLGDYSGGGLARCNGTIQDNVISGNSAGGRGGGLSECHGAIRNNVISGNQAGDSGGGLASCYGVIQGNVISGNTAGAEGGGLFGCSYAIESNAICWNLAGSNGGGLAHCDRLVQNDTIYGNRAGANGGGLYHCRGSIRNCIIWRNEALESGNQLDYSSIPLFSCVQDWDGTGEGSTGENPLLVDPDGLDDDPSTYDDNDYHLKAESPCIDRGVNYYWLHWPQRDLDGNCRLAGEQVDIGCYEWGSFPDRDGDLLSDQDEAVVGTTPDAPDADGDGLCDGLEILRGTNPAERTPAGIVRVPAEMRTVQQALCLALRGEEIVVSPGVYRENIHFSGRDVVLRGSDPHDPDVVRSTILDGGGAAPVASFMGTQSEACLLSGLTIRNGAGHWGGGIHGGGRATILNNVIAGNRADYGGAIHGCQGIILNNTICANLARGSGGGLASCHGTIQNNLIFANRAGLPGELIGRGGGLTDCNGTIQNNTIVRNFANDMDGDLFHCMAAIQNCIIWGNTPRHQSPWWETPSHSCIEGYQGPGEGNIAEEPGFVDAENGDFRLIPDSPCIDAGFNDADLPATDIAGMHRIMYGGRSLTVDMGAYEYYINKVEPVPGTDEAIFTWSSLEDQTYTIFYTDDLFNWHTAIDNFPSLGNTTTSWTDDGTLTGLPPSLVPRRFYRILENP